MDETFDTQAAIEAQKKFCEEHDYPVFAPTLWGECYKCRRNIFKVISVERAGSHLITGCPYCGYSFCD